MSQWASKVVGNVKTRTSSTIGWAKGMKESLQEIFEKHRVFLTISSTILSCGAAWVGLVARQAHMHNLELQLGEINRILKDELKQKINPPESTSTKEESRAIFMMKTGFFVSACGISYMLGHSRGRKAALDKLGSHEHHATFPKAHKSSLERAAQAIPSLPPKTPTPVHPNAPSSSHWLSKIRSIASHPKTATESTKTSSSGALNSMVSSPLQGLFESRKVVDAHNLKSTGNGEHLMSGEKGTNQVANHARKLSEIELQSLDEQDVIDLNSSGNRARPEKEGNSYENESAHEPRPDERHPIGNKQDVQFMSLSTLQVTIDPPLENHLIIENPQPLHKDPAEDHTPPAIRGGDSEKKVENTSLSEK